MRNFDQLIESLANHGVPKKELKALRDMTGHLSRLDKYYARVGLPNLQSLKLQKILAQFMISSTAIFLLKKYTGKKILVVQGTARVLPGTHAYDRIVRLTRLAGPDWIIVHGGGGGIMDAARVGGLMGGSITVGLHFDSEFVINGASGTVDQINLYHTEFYSRMFAFLEYADAIVIDEGGLGTLQEKSWAEGCIQCGIHRAIPIFVLSKNFWKHLANHTDLLIEQKLASPQDQFLIRVVDDGKEEEVYSRIAAYYAARPDLVAAQLAALGVGGT